MPNAASVMQGSGPNGPPPNESYWWDCPAGDSLPETFTVPDGKGFQVIVDQNVNGTAWDGAGDEVDSGLTDPNGNTMRCTGSGCSDPLGSALTISGSGTLSSPIEYGYPGPGGAMQYITLNFASEYVQGSFGCSYSNYAGYLNLPSSLVYPDVTGRAHPLQFDPVTSFTVLGGAGNEVGG